MAGLPSSGNLSIKTLAGSTRSIELEVEGNTSGTITVSSLRSQSGFSSPVSISDWYGYSSASPPTAPSNAVGLFNDRKMQISMTWNDNSSDETGFRIEVSVNSGGYTYKTNVAAGTTYYNAGLVGEGNSYRYRIRAYNGAGDSGWTYTGTVWAGVPT